MPDSVGIYCDLKRHYCLSLERIVELRQWEGQWFPYPDYKCTAQYCPLRDVDKSQKE